MINFLENSSFHHIGYASKDIEKEQKYFELLGFKQESEIFIDESQGIRGVFLKNSDQRIELLENLPGSKTLDVLLKKGIHMYHLAYIVENLYDTIDFFRNQKAILIRKPMESVAFNKKQICFMCLANGLIIELIEK